MPYILPTESFHALLLFHTNIGYMYNQVPAW